MAAGNKASSWIGQTREQEGLTEICIAVAKIYGWIFGSQHVDKIKYDTLRHTAGDSNPPEPKSEPPSGRGTENNCQIEPATFLFLGQVRRAVS